MATNWEVRTGEVRDLILAAFADDKRPEGPADGPFALPREQLTPRDYERHGDEFRRLSRAEQRYHLPGLLLAGLQGRYVLPALVPDASAARAGHDVVAEAVLEGLTPSQRHAFGEFLALLLEVAHAPRSLAAVSNPLYRLNSSCEHRGAVPSAVQLLAWVWRDCGHPAVAEADAIVARWTGWQRPPLADVQAEAVVAELEAAWADMPRPTEWAFETADARDGGGLFVRWLLARTDWHRLGPDVVESASSSIRPLPTAALAYLLPAWLSHAAQRLGPHAFDGFGSLQFEQVLPVSEERWLPERAAAVARCLNPRQRLAVAGWLALLAKRVPQRANAVGEAIATIWTADGPAPTVGTEREGAVDRPATLAEMMAQMRESMAAAIAAARSCSLPADDPDDLGYCPPPNVPPLSTAERDSLLAQIRAAFAGTPRPRPRRPFAELPDFHNCPELPDVAARWRRTVGGRPWDQVDDRVYAGVAHYFGRLRPEVWRYYLPGMLTAVVRSGAGTSGLAPFDYYIARLGHDPLFERSKAALTAAQREAVCSVLGLFLDEPPSEDDGLSLWDDQRRDQWGAAQPLKHGWHDVPHPAVERALAAYRRWFGFVWPQVQDPELRSLIAQIREAFEATPYPPEGVICRIEHFDPEPLEYEVELRGADWRTLHPDVLANCYSALSFFEPAAFRYFLPAYLIAELMGVGGNANPSYSLTTGFYEGYGSEHASWLPGLDLPQIDWRAHGEAQCAQFSNAERLAIVAYLRHAAEHDEFERGHIEQALESYWLPSIAVAG